MARALSQILKELDVGYDPQRAVYNKQIQGLDPLQEAELKGLNTVKRDSFDQITNQANRRGLFYSGIPIAEEQRYTGQTYLPAVANLRSRFQQQKFNLQDALAQITQKQYAQAYGIREQELARDLQEKALARARAGGGGAGGAGGFDMSGFGGAPAQQRAGGGGIDWSALTRQNNPWVFKDVLSDANKQYFKGKASYGQLAGWLQQRIGQIPNGSAADLALRNLFLKTDLGTGGRTGSGGGSW